jgi:hypothetical protein
MIVENREARPELDNRLVEVFKSLGSIESRLDEIEKKTNINAQNHIMLEKELFTNFKELKETVIKINEQLIVAAALEKERQETRASIALERRESDKLNREKDASTLIPKWIDTAVKICALVVFAWGLFTFLNK